MNPNKIINFDSVERYSPDFKYGLNDSEVSKRKEQGLVNKKSKLDAKSLWGIIRRNIFSLMNLICFFVVILIFYTGDFGSLFFFAILLAVIGIGLYFDLKARYFLKQKAISNVRKVKVVRNGNEIEVNKEDIVLDDIVIFSEKDEICIDGVILNGSLGINDSNISGNTRTIFKNVGDEIVSGSIVLYGKAYIKANKIGEMCQDETINNGSSKTKRNNRILDSFRILSIVLLIACAVVIGLTFLSFGLNGVFPNNESIKNVFGTIRNVLIAAVPIGLSLAVCSSFAYSAINLKAKKMMVLDYNYIETLSQLDVLCIDKTGTLTNKKMKVKGIEILSDSFKEEQIKQIVSNILIATNDSNETALTLKEYFNYELTNNISKSLPFKDNNKYCAASFKAGSTYVLGIADYIELENKQSVLRRTSDLCAKGYKVLVLGKNNTEIVGDNVSGSITPIALITLEETLNKDAFETIEWLKENNIEVKIISGDNALTVSEIAKEAGIESAERYISLEGMSPEEVRMSVDKYNVFGNASAKQKEILISSLKAEGKTVGMVGDGLNDVLALKCADCSIALDSGDSRAMASSQMIIEESKFSSLKNAVLEGKRVSKGIFNIGVLFIAKTVFSILVFLAFLVSSLITHDVTNIYPYSSHLYVLDIVSLGIICLLFIFEPPDVSNKKSLIKGILKKSIPIGLLCSIALFAPFILYFLEQNNFGYFSLNSYEQTIGVSLIAFGITGFVIVGEMLWRFNKFRLIGFMLAIVIDVAFLLITYFIGQANASGYISTYELLAKLTLLNYFEALIISAGICTIYLGFAYIFRIIRREKGNENL